MWRSASVSLRELRDLRDETLVSVFVLRSDGDWWDEGIGYVFCVLSNGDVLDGALLLSIFFFRIDGDLWSLPFLRPLLLVRPDGDFAWLSQPVLLPLLLLPSNDMARLGLTSGSSRAYSSLGDGMNSECLRILRNLLILLEDSLDLALSLSSLLVPSFTSWLPLRLPFCMDFVEL